MIAHAASLTSLGYPKETSSQEASLNQIQTDLGIPFVNAA